MKAKGRNSRGRRKPKPKPSPSPSSSSSSPIDLIKKVLFASSALPSPKSTIIHAKAKSKSRSKRPSLQAHADGNTPRFSKDAKSAFTGSTSEKVTNSIQDLKDFASSQLEKLRSHVDLCHSAILKDFDASHARLRKRLKCQMQMCQEVMGEVDDEYKKISKQMSENRKAMKATFVEFIQGAQASSSHACKVSISEVSQSFEKNLDALRMRFGIASS